MRDRTLSPESKAIYAYMCSFAGEGDTAFPSAETMMDELGMANKRFYGHRKRLIDAGLIEVRKGRRDGSKYEHNIYHLPLNSKRNAAIRSLDDGECRNDTPQTSTENGQCRNDTPQINGQCRNDTPHFVENPEFAQVNGQCRFGTVQNDTTKVGWMDGLDPKTNQPTSNGIPVAGSGYDREIEDAFARMDAIAVNRNLLAQPQDIIRTKGALATLAKSYPTDQIVARWAKKHEDLLRSGCEERYYPQLCRWLEHSAERELAGSAKRAEACATPSERKAHEHEVAEAQRFEGDAIYAKLKSDLEEAGRLFRELNTGATGLSGNEYLKREEEVRAACSQARAALDAYVTQAENGEKQAA